MGLFGNQSATEFKKAAWPKYSLAVSEQISLQSCLFGGRKHQICRRGCRNSRRQTRKGAHPPDFGELNRH